MYIYIYIYLQGPSRLESYWIVVLSRRASKMAVYLTMSLEMGGAPCIHIKEVG